MKKILSSYWIHRILVAAGYLALLALFYHSQLEHEPVVLSYFIE